MFRKYLQIWLCTYLGWEGTIYLLFHCIQHFGQLLLYEKCYINKVWLIESGSKVVWNEFGSVLIIYLIHNNKYLQNLFTTPAKHTLLLFLSYCICCFQSGSMFVQSLVLHVCQHIRSCVSLLGQTGALCAAEALLHNTGCVHVHAVTGWAPLDQFNMRVNLFTCTFDTTCLEPWCYE